MSTLKKKPNKDAFSEKMQGMGLGKPQAALLFPCIEFSVPCRNTRSHEVPGTARGQVATGLGMVPTGASVVVGPVLW